MSAVPGDARGTGEPGQRETPEAVPDRQGEAAPPARAAALAMAPEQFRLLGHALVDRIATELQALRERPVAQGAATLAQVRERVGERGLPSRGEDAGAVLEEAAELLFGQTPRAGHPRYHGYIAASPAPIGMLAELLSAAVNANVALWQAAPVAAEIEAQTVRWLAELVGYPVDCGGLLVSGGSMANLVALLAARRARLRWDVREQGLQGARLAVYASRETHGWLHKAVDLAGLGTGAIRWIATDGEQRLDVAALAAAVEADVAAGVLPLMAVASAGTVATGAVDPLPEMAALCRRHGLWLHVDGAYGAPAACLLGCERHAGRLGTAGSALRALGLADSLALDPHKWLYVPIEAGCVLVRERAHLRDAFGHRPSYYAAPGAHEGSNFHELGPQNTRGLRALKVWLALRAAGLEGYREMIAADIALAQRLFERVRRTPRLEALTVRLGIATFRYRAPGVDDTAELDALNRALLRRLQHDGRAWLSHAVVEGRFALRACIVNFHTDQADVDALPGLVVELGDALLAEPG